MLKLSYYYYTKYPKLGVNVIRLYIVVMLRWGFCNCVSLKYLFINNKFTMILISVFFLFIERRIEFRIK